MTGLITRATFVTGGAWFWPAVGAAILAVLAAQQLRIEHLKTEHAQTLATLAQKAQVAAQAAATAERAARTTERSIRDEQAENARKAAARLAVLAAAADRERASRERLRRDLAAYVARARAVPRDSAPGAHEPPAADAIGVLADVLGRADARAGVLAAFADRAHAAGLACEADYDAAYRGLKAWR
jgi:hypothetical protein